MKCCRGQSTKLEPVHRLDSVSLTTQLNHQVKCMLSGIAAATDGYHICTYAIWAIIGAQGPGPGRHVVLSALNAVVYTQLLAPTAHCHNTSWHSTRGLACHDNRTNTTTASLLEPPKSYIHRHVQAAPSLTESVILTTGQQEDMTDKLHCSTSCLHTQCTRHAAGKNFDTSTVGLQLITTCMIGDTCQLSTSASLLAKQFSCRNHTSHVLCCSLLVTTKPSGQQACASWAA
jgi:hypothetical protein